MNWERVESKIKKRLMDQDLRGRIGTYIDGMMMTRNIVWISAKGQQIYTAADIARKFIEALSFVIIGQETAISPAAGGLGRTAVESLTELDFLDARKLSRYRYLVGVYFKDSLYRPSLFPQKYDGVQNIAALLNSGFGTTRNDVFGFWHGAPTLGLRERVGAHFLETAKDEFMAMYGDKYGVEKIDLADVYQ
jgi:hypothetical protein